MLSEKTRVRIKRGTWVKMPNKSKWLTDLKTHANNAIKDLTLIANHIPEEVLSEIFRPMGRGVIKREQDEYLETLFGAILEPTNVRTILLNEMIANLVFQKLKDALPTEMVNELGSDIGKTWTYAKVLARYADKPLMRKD